MNGSSRRRPRRRRYSLRDHALDVNENADYTDRSVDALEDRVAAIEELLTVPWPRSILARHRLRRQLLGSVAGYETGESFCDRRAQWMSEQIYLSYGRRRLRSVK